jgi:fucose permease
MSSIEALNAKHVRASGILSILGLLLVGLSLVWDRPISTYVVIYVGAALVLAGAGLFLYSFITHFLARRHM